MEQRKDCSCPSMRINRKTHKMAMTHLSLRRKKTWQTTVFAPMTLIQKINLLRKKRNRRAVVQRGHPKKGRNEKPRRGWRRPLLRRAMRSWRAQRHRAQSRARPRAGTYLLCPLQRRVEDSTWRFTPSESKAGGRISRLLLGFGPALTPNGNQDKNVWDRVSCLQAKTSLESRLSGRAGKNVKTSFYVNWSLLCQVY